MMIRDYQPEDRERLEELFAKQQFEYQLPDFSDAQFVVNQVLVDDEGKIVQAICARQTVELYMLGDPDWRTPAWRMAALAKLHESMRQALEAMGIQDAHAWLPPEVAKSFGRRLMRDFGWKKPDWTDYFRETRP